MPGYNVNHCLYLFARRCVIPDLKRSSDIFSSYQPVRSVYELVPLHTYTEVVEVLLVLSL